MSILFSKITLETDSGCTLKELIGGIPNRHSIQKESVFRDFCLNHPEEKEIGVGVQGYRFGKGPAKNADEDHLALISASNGFLNHDGVEQMDYKYFTVNANEEHQYPQYGCNMIGKAIIDIFTVANFSGLIRQSANGPLLQFAVKERQGDYSGYQVTLEFGAQGYIVSITFDPDYHHNAEEI